MRIEVKYGEGTLPVGMPASAEPWVVRSKLSPPQIDLPRELEEALSLPCGASPLEQLARGKQTACIVISDNTRASPSSLLVAGILDRIRGHVRDVTVLVASGLHVPLSESEMEALVGPEVSARCALVSHDARDARGLARIGRTSRGLPILVNRLFLDSDLRILTGLVEPHFMAGYSGGRKSICPGILGRESIQFLHSPQLLESPRTDYAILAGNPVHEEASSVARTVGVDFLVNVALDGEQRVGRVATGDLEAAWFECVAFASTYAQAIVPERYDVVVTSNGGYPLDRSYYQVVKGLVAAARIVRPGGIIVIAAECRDGLGSEDFRQALGTLSDIGDLDRYIDYISQEHNWTIDQWEVEMLVRVLRRTSRVFVCSSGLRDDDLRLTCGERAASLEEALREARARLGPNLRVAVMPAGPFVIPTVDGDVPTGMYRRRSSRLWAPGKRPGCQSNGQVSHATQRRDLPIRRMLSPVRQVAVTENIRLDSETGRRSSPERKQ